MNTSHDLKSMFLNTGLYENFHVTNKFVNDLIRFNETLDLYCINCKEQSIFRRLEEEIPPPIAPSLDGGAGRSSRRGKTVQYNSEEVPIRLPFDIDEVKQEPKSIQKQPELLFFNFECGRDHTHIASFIFRFDGESIKKIGEYPSRADLASPELRKYKQLLGKKYFKELKNAIILANHHFGVGSFVHLRRIFEQVLANVAERKKKTEPQWDYDAFFGESSRVPIDVKIAELKDLLPEALVDNQIIYSILSKGLHELEEEECLTYFEVVKRATFYILDDIIAEEQKKKNRAAIQGELSKVHHKLEEQNKDST